MRELEGQGNKLWLESKIVEFRFSGVSSDARVQVCP